MNFNFYALRAIPLILVTLLLTNIASATSPDYPEIDEKLGKLLIDGMGGLMNDYPETNPDYPTFTDEHYRARFLEMSGEIQYRLTPDIKNHIIHRTERYRSATERTLGLSEMYFPIFEEYLAEKNIPHHLKYLPIVESNLNAVAKSHAAAVGLWQFIPGTGKLYGLKVVSYLDERSDTHKASQAAATMLSNLYKRYGDWPLALAAYNCGPGRVDKYVRGNDKDFWDIRKYLPRETQMYVPYFMAVAYSYEFHHLHELTAKRLPTDLVLTDSIHLEPGYQTLSQLSKKYKISLDTLKRLNPGYIKNYIPSGSQLNILVLPARIVAGLRDYAPAWQRIMSMKSENPIKCIRRVNSEVDLGKLMKAHRFSRNDLLFWNGLPSNYRVKKGDIVAVRKYRVPKDAWPKKEVRKDIQGISIASLKVVGLDDKQEKAVTAPVYVSIKNKKLAQKLTTTTVNPSNRKERSTFGTIPTTIKNEVITEISQNRSRDRRLRNNTETATRSRVNIQTNANLTLINEVSTQNTTTEKGTPALFLRAQEDALAKTAAATKRVTELSRSIQSKEQAIVKAKTYNATSAEEVATLSYLNNKSEELKEVRTTKKKDREIELAQAKVAAEQAAKEKAELQAKIAAEQAAKEKAELQAKIAAEQAAKEKAELQAKAAAEQAAKEEAELQAKVAAEQAAKEEAKLQAKVAAEQAAKEEAKLQAKVAAEQAAKEEEELQAKVAAEQAAKEEAKLQAKVAAEQAAKEEAKLQAKVAAEQAAKEEAKLQVKIENERLVSTYEYHSVKNNETILEIAAKYDVSVGDIKMLNNISTHTILRKGMELKIRKK